MNNKTLIIIGLFICLLFTIPMVSAAEVSADSDLIDNSVIGSNINSQAVATSDVNSMESNIDNIHTNTNDNVDTVANTESATESTSDSIDDSVVDDNDANSIDINDINNSEIDIDDSNNNHNNDSDNDEKITDINSGKNNKNSNDKKLGANVLRADGTGTTFGDLQYIIDQDTTGTITLTKDYTFVSGDDDAYITGIVINKDLIINGDGRTIDGSNLARIFYTQGEVSVTLNNLILINGNAGDGDGGAIIWDSHGGHINNVIISNCVAQNGGAVYIGHVGHDEPAFMENVTVKYSSATNGGAIYVKTQTAMNNITCINCSASQNGGAIFAECDGQGRGTDYFYLYNNSAGGNGGAVYIHGNNLAINHVDARNNTASGNGGAIYAYGNQLSLDGINFINNSATGPTSNGGGIYFDHGADDSIVNHAFFANNTANRNGGAIDWASGAHFGELYNSQFHNNTANRSAGAIYWYGNDGAIENCTFINNSALGITHDPSDFDGDETDENNRVNGGDGGAIVWTGSTGKVTNSNFTDNDAIYRGGAILVQPDGDNHCENTTIINCNFNSNDAGYRGGAIDWANNAINGTVYNSTFINNTAARSGGAISWTGRQGGIYGSRFADNKANGTNHAPVPGLPTSGGNGGAVVITGYDVHIEDSNFTNNIARARGGAVYLQNNNNTYVTNCNFTANHAGTNGGALDFYEGAAYAQVINSTFLNNTANRSGGGIYWNGHFGTINGSYFSGNIALNQGTYINGTTITDGGDGGAIIWTGSYGTVENTVFENNTATARGGAIYLQKNEHDESFCENTTVKNSTFINNTAGTNGGAIDWFEGAVNGTITDSRFIDNKANKKGGAVFWNGDHGTINNTLFNNNLAGDGIAHENNTLPTNDSDGGAVMWTGSNGMIANSNFTNNNASNGRGGGIYLQKRYDGDHCVNVTVDNCMFIENYAYTNGGAIDWFEGAQNGTIKNSTFENNTAGRDGGAVYWDGEYGVINDTKFINNTAIGQYITIGQNEAMGDGGAVLWTGSNGIIENTTFVNNSATNRGGAIFMVRDEWEGAVCFNTTVLNSTFINNTAGTNGGAIDWYEGARNGSVINSTFENNVAKNGHGGAIYWKGINGTIDGCNFTNNNATGLVVSGMGSTARGGALFVDGTNNTVNNSNFQFNYAGNNGSAIVFEHSLNGKVLNSNFTNNTAGANAGAVCFGVGAQYGTIYNSNFINNTANGSAGALGFQGSYGNVSDCHFINNTALGIRGADTGRGGSVVLLGSFNNVTNCTFENSSSTYEGSAIYVRGNNATIRDSNFTDNNATHTKEGKIAQGTINVLGNNTDIINCSFVNNTAEVNGTAIYISGHDTLVANSTFENHTSENGGAIFVKGANTTIAGSNFTNNNATQNGGAVYVEGANANISNSSFDDNRAIDGHGGAIYWEGFNGTVEGSNFTNNSNKLGGGIYIKGNLTDVTDCNFINNSAVKGGAILVEGNNATINLSNFINHHTDEEGGAIYINGTGTKLENSTFTNNTSHDDGGAIAWWGDNGTVYNITCLNNSGTSEGHTSSGGTISIYGSNIVMDRLNITEGYVVGRQEGSTERVARGGAIFLTGNNVTISNSTFTNCTVNSTMDSGINELNFDGGALYIIGNESKLINNTITGSIAHDGGAIYLSGNDGYIDGLNASENTATDAGGVLYISGNNTTVANSTFNNNTAWDDGAAIDWIGNDGKMYNVTASDNKGISNGHTSKGGTFSIEGNNTNINTVNVTNSYVTSSDLSRVSQGGGMLVSGNNANISNIAFNNCSVKYTGSGEVGDRDFDGGAIYIYGNNTYIENATITNSTSPHNGGGILLRGNDAYMNNITAAENTATMTGGAMMIFGNNTILGNSTLANNTAIAGGAIYWQGNNGYANNATFIENYATDDGGALFVNGTNDAIANSNFTGNYAWDDGGAVKWEGNDGKIINLTASENHAYSVTESSKGGTLYISGNRTSIDGLDITSSSVNYLENPSSEPIQGGAVYLSGNNCNITNVNISDSHVLFDGITPEKGDEASGGAMYIVGNNTNIVNGTFSQNTAWADGGAVFIAGQNCNLNNTNFTENVAHNDGGALQIEGNNAKIYNLTADRNYADSISGSSQGGTIIITGNKTSMDMVDISNSYVDGKEGRRAIRGGAIFLTGNDCNITDASFTNCSIKWKDENSDGGAIYILGNNTYVSNANFTNNTVPGEGGALYVSGTDFKLNGGNFTDNVADLRGGAIFLTDNKNSEINNTYFENNSAGLTGGAINFYEGAEDGLVSACEFVNNTAGASGGSIYWEGTRGVIEYSSFDGSRALGNQTNATLAPNNGRGGSIIWLGDHGTIRGCDFNDSQSAKEGATLYVVGDLIKVQQSNFTNSQTNTSGGIYIQGSEGTISNCHMENTTAKESGGALYVKGNYIYLLDSDINNATSVNNGSAIYITGNTTHIENSNVTNCTSSSGNGTIMIAGYKTVMDGVNVDNNKAVSAGAVLISGSQTKISNSNFTHNNASKDAGGIMINGTDNTITTSNISDNYAKENGGGIYYTGDRNTVSYSNIDHNSANNGANVYMAIKAKDCKLIGSNITNAKARNFGGGVEWCENSENGLIQDCYFYNCTSTAHGGAIHWYPGKYGVIDNCTFVECHVAGTKNGGAIYAGANTNVKPVGTVLSNSTFINCTTGTRGAVNWNSQGGLIYNNTFINCGVANTSATTSWGGAQALQIEKGNNTQIIACEFYNCSGIGGGGALRVQGDGHSGYNITIANCTFDNCNNTGLAGGVYLSDMARNITFENNTFTNNSAPNVGAFFMDPKTVIVSFVNNTFINNSATGSSGYAGAAQLTGNLEVINSTFIENSAVSKAGAINAVEDYDGNNNLAIIGSTFQYNKAKEGSAINAINLDMTDTVLLENQAAFDKWTNQRNSRANGHVSINGTFVGKDNYLNGIKANGATFDNVTYCGVNGGGLYEDTVTNTDDVTSAKSTNEVHQLIVLEIYDYNNNLVDTKTTFTDENGKFNFEFDMENPQDYSYKVIHPEDNYYTGAEYSIGKAISNITIKSQNITHPEDENITFKVTGGSGTPTGNITVFINDTEGNVIFNDTIILNSTGEAKLFFPRLNASEYYIEAKYNGDNNYLPDNDTSIFHVNMAESFIKIGIENYTYNETRNITITVPYIESGRISVIVTNENFTQLYTVYVNEGTEEVQIQLPILDAGVYDIEAIFHGNNNYYPSQNATNFTVFKAASIINITADNVSGGVRETVDIHIDPEVATQNINLTVYDAQGNIVDQYYDLGLHDSRVTQILTLLPKGKYNVTVTYPGDKNHNASSNSTIFYVTNDLFPIEINATNMTYGDDQIINITVPANADPDKLYININCSDWPGNKTVTELGLTIDENGLIQIDTTNTNLFANKIDAGNYTINVYYPGDDDFLSNSSSVDFEVAKAIPEMNVTPTNITYGNLEDILVEIAQNGNVTLYVTSENDPTLNITKIEVEIIEGKVYWNVNDTYLPAGEYMVEAIFNGNRNYESVNKTEKFNVTKAIPNIVIDVDDIHVGDSEYINVTVEGVEHGTTPQGNIKIIVRTIDQIVELNATGQYNLTLDDEVQGNGISVTVIYYGDDNYNYTEKSVYYDVTKKETSINVTGATPISYGTIENLLAEVNETGVTGTITIYVNSTVDGFINQTHVATITVDDAGKATWDIDQIILPVGSYDVTAVYSGDDKFEGSVSTVKVIVVEKATDYDISVEANNTVYGTDQVIIVTVPDNANGTVTITIEGTEISLTSQVENGKAVFTIPNDLVDFLEVHDNYNVTATYNGDDKYAAGVKASDLFNVTKAESHIKVVAEDIDYTQIENITVILPDFNATGKIVITIVNKSDTTQIVRTLEVDPFTNTTGVIYPFEGLLVGNYTVKVEYSGDHNYNNSENTTDFEVRKVDPTLTENSPDIIYGADENITVTITGATGGVDPTGTIQVIVDGVTIDTITIGDKDLEFIVSKPGVDSEHNITVIYSGDSNYNPVTITGEFAVTQNNTIEMEEVSPNIIYGNNETITITLPNDATGTVYLVVNGTYYTPIGIDENHQAVFKMVAPIVGEYKLTAYYSGDENYAANNISGEFNVTKADVSLSESHTAIITYGANDTITVTITGVEGPEGVLAPTGTIKVLVDGEELGNVTIGDALVFNSIRPFVDPQHNITIIYSGDNNYNSKIIDNTVLDTLVFEVIKNNTLEISEDSPDIFYTENETITVTISGDATGTITVTVGGEQVGEVVTLTEITEDDKVFTFNITKPEGGVYDDLTVVYSGDSNYDSATLNGEFTVNPIDPNITEDSPDIVYTNNEVITITVPEGATGNLTVTVKNSKGDTVETKKLVIGTDDLVVTIEKPAVDNYTFTVDYTGCTNYTEKTITGEFKVTKASNEITVVPTNITYGQTETITVTVPEGATGNVTITVGTYTDMLEIPEGSTEVVFTIPKTAADELLNVNDNYIVFANYSGDSNYESVVANAPFHVDPANTTLTIEVANITYGEDEIINVTVNGVTGGDIPTGFVTIKLNGTDIELTKAVDSEGKVQFNVSGLVVGEYTVNATFVSSSINYNDSNNTAKFNVTKADVKEANMNITAINITYGDDETITVILNETNITGNVTITINGTEIETKELVDGKVVFTVPDLEVNGYNVVANYSGDHNYNAIPIGANFNTDFKVDKANVTVVVTPVDIIYKETEEINVTVTGVFINDNVNDNLTGKVTIYIDGVENQTKDISAVDEYGILHFSVEGLAVGTHNVTAVYHDDRNYNDNNATEDFEVINALPEDMKVIPQNITYHIQTETITVDLGEVLNGTVQLYINDTLVATFEVIDQRTVSYTNNSLAVGNYTAKAVFTANGDFVNASANFTVSKAPVTVDVVAEDSVYGETQTITVNVDNTVPDKYNLTGNVSITINGVDYGNKTVDANGQAVFEITGLEANDNYQVIATYYNDPNYLDNTGQDTFKVSKADVKDVNKNITAINITYGEDETITVTLNEDNITGKVTITINGTEIETKELEDGKAVFTVKDLEVNGYNVVANYSGDTNYNPFTIEDNLNANFTVGKANSTVNVTAVPTIVYGNNETITVTVPIRNHTGTITLTINGSDYQFIKHLTAEDGDTIVLTNVSGLAVGLYNVTVTYDNDRNYNDSEAYALFEVVQAIPTNITVTPQNITYTEDEIITVTVGDENATGNITIRIEGTNIVKEAEIENGEAKFNVTGLVVGHYTVIANYSGDANYTSLEVSAPFHVDKAASNVTIEVANITYGEIEYANITIPNYNASGRVIIKVDGQAYDILPLSKDTPINLELGGLAVGTHTIDVEYFDDENYNKSIAHAEFNVTKAAIPEANVTVVPTNITYLDDETIAVTINVTNATGNVTIKINGTDVVLTKNITEDGSNTVTFTVPGLVVGDYNVTVEYTGDANYNDTNASALFKVSPLASNVTVEAINITYLDDETITVTVPITNATGTVVVKINGTTVDERTVSGDNPTYDITVPGLAVGEYNVTVEYSNDVNYNDSNASALFNVKQSAPVNLTVEATNVTYGENVTVTVTVPDDATGNVTITIGDYTETKNITAGSNTVVFTVPDLEVNNYVVYANYSGDNNYESGIVNTPFHVDKANSTVTVEAINITYGDDETITVTVPNNNATGWVTLTVNGTEIGSKKIDADGKAVFTVSGLAVGEYEASVVYEGDRNYNGNNNVTNFTVSKAAIPDANVTVVPTNITYLDDETITVTINVTNATGNVTIKINGTDVELTKNITEDGSNTVTFTVPGLVVGDYNVTVEYTADANYNDTNASALFTVSPVNSTVSVEAVNITYLDNETITVTVPITNASGTVVVKINGTTVDERTVSGDNPTYDINVPDLAVGEYNVTVEYKNDVNYNDSNASTLFHVDKANVPDANMTVVPTNITYLDDETIVVTVDVVNASGEVTITINGTDVNITKSVDSDGKATFTVSDLPVGEYNVTAVYHNDVNYNDKNASALFHVDPIASSVTVVPTNVTYPDDETITVTVPITNASGTVVVKINGTTVDERTVSGDNPSYTITVPGLAVGEYNVTVEYSNDVNYNDTNASALFHVDKGNIADINVNASNITYGDNETITITIGDKNATGNITIKVNGTEYGPQEIVDGSTTFNVPGLGAGEYEVEVSYSGDDNYNATTANAIFTVDKATPNVYAVGTNITYGNDEQITAIVDGKNITGNVTIFIDGQEYDTVNLTQTETGGRVILNVPGLSAGNHNVTVLYNGDDNHYSNNGTDNFTVSKANATVDVNTTDIDFHETENINITLPEDATGTVNVTVVGDNGVTKTFNDVSVGPDGTVNVPVEDLPAGNYNVTVNYSGDGNYTAANGTAKFSVDKINSTVDVETTNITYGDNETIKYSVPDDATGTVNVTVVGDNGVTKIFTDVPVENGTVGINVAELPAGNYNVTVQYSGDDNYNPSVGKADFTVEKSNSTMSINTSDIDYHDTENITVNVTGVEGGVTPTGTVNVTVTGDNGVTKTFNDVSVGPDGTVIIPVEDLPVGNYDVTVNYSGDDNYNATSGTASFSVDKIDSAVKVNASDITYGDNETVTLTVKEDATGTVNVTVTGDNGVTKTFTDIPIDGSDISEILSDLPAGDYNVTVDYSGDVNYNPETIKTGFTVDKATPNAYAVGTNITYGDKDQITAIVDGKNITGNVTIFIDGQEYDTVNLTQTETGGRAILNVPDLSAGNHNVTVLYNGDDNHYTSNGTDNFTVFKAEPTMDINTTDIDLGETENITVNVTGVTGGVTPTGTVNVTVTGDNGVTKTFTDIPIDENGNVTIPVENLPVGNYNVTVNYSGDENYTAINGTGKFSVGKIDPTVDVNTSDITYGENETVTVTLPEDATGDVTIIIKDKDGTVVKNETVHVTEDGKASIDVSGLDAGDYNVSVEYGGDNNYNPASGKANFTVNKANPTVNVQTDNIDYHDTENIVVNVTAVDGGLTPTGTVNITIKGDNGESKTYTDLPLNEDGTVTMPVDNLPSGNYNVTVNYSGDKNYNPSVGESKFSVGLIDTPIDLETENITYGESETLTVTVPKDATGDVTIVIRDKDGTVVKNETVRINDGTAELKVADLNAGNYTVQVDYPGDGNYRANSTNGKFEVAKANATVEIHVYDIVYGDIEELTVTCNAPGTVTIYVNGAEVTLPLENGYAHIVFASGLGDYSGKAQWDLENLAVGTYPARVHYNGNENYNEDDDNDVFNVIKANTTTKISVDDIKYGEDAVIDISVTHKTGSEIINANITVTVDGKEYTVELKDGKGTLTVPGLKAGEHTVKAKYPGSHNYTESSDTAKFNVTKYSSTTKVTPKDIKVGDDETVTVTVPKDATGNVTITVGGKTYTAPVKDGKAVFKVPGLKAGNYTVKAKYSGDDKYSPSSGTAKFTVSKKKPKVSLKPTNIKVGDKEKITVNVPEDATGKVTITVNGKKYTAKVKDGKAVFTVPGLKAGEYTVKAHYSGDKKYLPKDSKSKFTVSKVKPDIETNAPTVKVGKDGKVTVKVPKDATGKVTITVNGKKYTAEVKDGKAVFTVPGLKAGKYSIKVHYSGDEKYKASTVDGGYIKVVGQNDNGHKKKAHGHGKSIDLESKATGNPIAVLLLVFASLVLIPLRRRKDDEEDEDENP